MKNRRNSSDDKRQRKPGSHSQAGARTLTSYNVGALPILNRMIDRVKLEQFFSKFLGEDKRCTIRPAIGTLLLLKNYLVSREPVYGIGDWARQFLPDLLELSAPQVSSLNDDRVGRSLDRLFQADCSALILEVTRHVIDEFNLDLSEIHNDSTTVTFCGDYAGAAEETTVKGKKAPAIIWGFNKDHRPDLKQLLYNLTITSDGGVPVAFGLENGNVTDDQTHRANWDLLCEIVGGPDFIYVADSKLATHDNMSHIANRGGRFISVLPRTRGEDKEFREKLVQGSIEWKEIDKKVDDNDVLVDSISESREPAATAEGFRLLWFHSTRKIGLDRKARSDRIRRTFAALAVLRLRLRSPRTRYREKDQVERAVAKRVAKHGGSEWVTVEIRSEEREVFRQEKPGRPGPTTRYVREVKTRFDILYAVNREKVEEAEKQDGVFPLVTNDLALCSKEVLATYKRQSQIEKRFSQLKTQFVVAPVFLKSVHRVVALLTIYYFVLLVQTLVEREIRLRMREEGIDSIPLYPEERKCKAPTTRRIIDLFENIQLHTMRSRGSSTPLRFATELSQLQREVLRLLHVPESDYEA